MENVERNKFANGAAPDTNHRKQMPKNDKISSAEKSSFARRYSHVLWMIFKKWRMRWMIKFVRCTPYVYDAHTYFKRFRTETGPLYVLHHAAYHGWWTYQILPSQGSYGIVRMLKNAYASKIVSIKSIRPCFWWKKTYLLMGLSDLMWYMHLGFSIFIMMCETSLRTRENLNKLDQQVTTESDSARTVWNYR